MFQSQKLSRKMALKVMTSLTNKTKLESVDTETHEGLKATSQNET